MKQLLQGGHTQYSMQRLCWKYKILLLLGLSCIWTVSLLHKNADRSIANSKPLSNTSGKKWDDYVTITERLASELPLTYPRDLEQLAKLDVLLQQDGTFSDMDYSDGGQPGELKLHATRLLDVVMRDLLEKKQLSHKAKMSFFYLTYKVPKINSSNLWEHVIGVPENVWQLVFRCRNHLDETVKLAFLDRYFANGKHGPVWNPTLNHPENVGANLATRTFLGLVEHLMRGQMPKYHQQLKAALHKELILRDVYQGEGMRQDGCIHQHNRVYKRKTQDGKTEDVILALVYNNNYGKEIVRWWSQIMWLLDGTAFDLGDEIEEGIFAAFLECHQWLYRWRTVEPSTAGRYIDSGERVTRMGGEHGVRDPLKYFERIPRHRHEIASAILRYNGAFDDNQFLFEGNRHFFVSDLMAHQRKNFMASLRILSRRTCRPETIPPAGYSKAFYFGTSKGYFLGDGFLTLLITGKEFGSPKKEIFQAYDWARIPGATIQYTEHVPQVTTGTSNLAILEHSYNDADFVGGVTNRMEGVAAMDYARPTVALTARKSWFFFDNVILCLGSGISLPIEKVTYNQVTTTLNQILYDGMVTVGKETQGNDDHFHELLGWKLSKYYHLSKGIWFHHGSIGYVPISNEGEITLEVNKRYIEGGGNASLQIFSLWLNHGPKPQNSKYAYAILPGHSVAQTREFASNRTTRILSLTSSQHVACFDPLKILGIAFFFRGCATINACIPTRLEQVCSDQPSLLMIKDFGSSPAREDFCPNGVRPMEVPSEKDVLRPQPQVLQISIADPTQKLENITLKFKAGETLHVVQVRPTPPPKSGDSVVICLELI